MHIPLKAQSELLSLLRSTSSLEDHQFKIIHERTKRGDAIFLSKWLCGIDVYAVLVISWDCIKLPSGRVQITSVAIYLRHLTNISGVLPKPQEPLPHLSPSYSPYFSVQGFLSKAKSNASILAIIRFLASSSK